MNQEERDHTESLLHIYQAHLRQLELIEAKFGPLAVPPHIRLEIDENNRKIADLEALLSFASSNLSEGPRHNLPPREYEHFVGRQAELLELRRLLSSNSRAFVIMIDGVGGIGKSALALETAYVLKDQDTSLSLTERFAAIVWISAKYTYLTAHGIRERRQVFRTLGDVFAAIARVLDEPALTRMPSSEQRTYVEMLLRKQRVLLVLDNMETVDDEELIDFLHELPEPSKALITTRHRIDVARPLHLMGMDYRDALTLIRQEAAHKQVVLTPTEQEQLWQRSGGVPLAMVWSIGLIHFGHSSQVVLRRLKSGQSDIARFCFSESAAQIRGDIAEQLLGALALFDHSVSRTMVGAVAGLGNDAISRDESLADLLRLSLINQHADRFSLLPLTQYFALELLSQQPAQEQELRERWMHELIQLALPYTTVHHMQPSPQPLLQDGMHLLRVAHWTQQTDNPTIYLAILPALLYYTDTIGDWDKVVSFASYGLEQATLIGREEEKPRIYCTIAWIKSQQGHHDEAEQALQTAQTIAHQNEALIWEIEALSRLAQTVRRRGNLIQAVTYCNEAYTLSKGLSGSLLLYTQGELEYEKGKIARDSGDWETARRSFQITQRIFDYHEDAPAFNIERAWGVLGNNAYVLAQLGEASEALLLFQQSLTFFRQFGGRGYTTTLLVRLADLEMRLHLLKEAYVHAQEALEHATKLGMIDEIRQAKALIHQLETSREM